MITRVYLDYDGVRPALKTEDSTSFMDRCGERTFLTWGIVAVRLRVNHLDLSEGPEAFYVDVSSLQEGRAPYGTDAPLTNAWLSRKGSIIVAHGLDQQKKEPGPGQYLPREGSLELQPQEGLAGILVHEGAEPRGDLVDQFGTLGKTVCFGRYGGVWTMGEKRAMKGHAQPLLMTMSSVYARETR